MAASLGNARFGKSYLAAAELVQSRSRARNARTPRSIVGSMIRLFSSRRIVSQVFSKSIRQHKRYLATDNRIMQEADPQRVHSTSQSSFTSNAALYDKARPSYVPGSINALIKMLKLEQGSKVLDLVRHLVHDP